MNKRSKFFWGVGNELGASLVGDRGLVVVGGTGLRGKGFPDDDGFEGLAAHLPGVSVQFEEAGAQNGAGGFGRVEDSE